MLKNLAISVLIYEKVTTTKARAKEVRALVDKAINIAKKNDLAARRNLLNLFLQNKNVVNKLINDLAPRLKDTKSGYAKLYNISPRVGDNAPRVTIILSKSKFLNNLTPEIKEKPEENIVKPEEAKTKKDK